MLAFADNIFVSSHCRRDIDPSYLEVVAVAPSLFLRSICHSYYLTKEEVLWKASAAWSEEVQCMNNGWRSGGNDQRR